eukprot:2774678-Amphidinium_carterae.1
MDDCGVFVPQQQSRSVMTSADNARPCGLPSVLFKEVVGRSSITVGSGTLQVLDRFLASANETREKKQTQSCSVVKETSTTALM